MRTLHYNRNIQNYQAPAPHEPAETFSHTLKKEGAKRMKIWVADGEEGLMGWDGSGWRRMGEGGYALCAGMGKIFCAGASRCLCLGGMGGEALFDFPVPGGVCAMGMVGERICALSSDADSLSAFCARTGVLLFSAPAGDYPRDLCVSPCGKYLAVAGGAAGEILLFDESLSCIQKRRVPGAACAVCFLPRHIAALCAVGDQELSARLMLISKRGVVEEVFSCPHAPCALCPLPGGKVLVGCHGEVAAICEDGHVLRRVSCAYPARLRPFRGEAMILDGWQGRVITLGGRMLYQGREPWDAIILGN